MLTLYRRHRKGCAKVKDRYWKRCDCPCWVEGTLNGRYTRHSLKTLSWEQGSNRIEQLEKVGRVVKAVAVPAVEDAIQAYITECRTSGFSSVTVYQHERFLGRFSRWCQAHNYRTVNEVSTDCLREWFAESPNKLPGSKLTERKGLSAWWNYCKSRGWVTDDNPVKRLSKLIVRPTPTDYLRPDEFERLLAECRGPLYAFVLLLRWSGLRLSDAVSLERARIDANATLFLYTGKTGEHVSMPLRDRVIIALRDTPLISDRRFFMVEGENVFSVGERFRRGMQAAGKQAKLEKHVHPHVLRDTFAIELLLAGTPLDQVSKLLGHSTIMTTERHYAPFVKARQDQLTASVRSSWV